MEEQAREEQAEVVEETEDFTPLLEELERSAVLVQGEGHFAAAAAEEEEEEQGGGAEEQGEGAEEQGRGAEEQGGGAEEQGGGAKRQGGGAKRQGGGAKEVMATPVSRRRPRLQSQGTPAGGSILDLPSRTGTVTR